MKKKSGFTLIELLVALSIFSVITVALGAALRGGIDAWTFGEKQGVLQQEIRVTFDQIARELHNAVSFPGATIMGKNNEITFYQVKDVFLSKDEVVSKEVLKTVYKQEVIQTKSEESLYGELKSVFFKIEETMGKEEVLSGLRKQQLTSFPTDVKFEYAYAPQLAGSSPRWENKWENPKTFPAGIRVSLTLTIDEEEDPILFVKTIDLPVGVLVPWKG